MALLVYTLDLYVDNPSTFSLFASHNLTLLTLLSLQTNHFNIGSLMERGVRLIGNGQAPVHMYWKELLKMLQQGKLDPLQMITHRIRIEDMEEAYRMFDQKEDKMQKVFVETKFSDLPAPGTPQVAKLSKSK